MEDYIRRRCTLAKETEKCYVVYLHCNKKTLYVAKSQSKFFPKNPNYKKENFIDDYQPHGAIEITKWLWDKLEKK